MEGYDASASETQAETPEVVEKQTFDTALEPSENASPAEDTSDFSPVEKSAPKDEVLPSSAAQEAKDLPKEEAQSSFLRQNAVPLSSDEGALLAQLYQEAADYELNQYVWALTQGVAGERTPMAAAAIENYKLTRNPQDLAAVKQLFPPMFVALATSNSQNFNTQQAKNYDLGRRERMYSGISEALKAFEKEAGQDWLKENWRGDVVAEAIRLAGQDVSLPKVKKLLDAVEAGAIAKFKAEMKAEAENRSQIARLQSPTGDYTPGYDDNEDWHSIKDIETMNRKVLKFYEERNKCL